MIERQKWEEMDRQRRMLPQGVTGDAMFEVEEAFEPKQLSKVEMSLRASKKYEHELYYTQHQYNI